MPVGDVRVVVLCEGEECFVRVVVMCEGGGDV